MSNVRIKEYLTVIRDGFKKVRAITGGLDTAPTQEALENALSLREAVIVKEIDQKAQELSAAFPAWRARVKNDAGLRGILGETENLMRSIAQMDESLTVTLKQRMGDVKKKFSSLYRTSRAAYSYTAQSKLRVELSNPAHF